MSDSLECAVCEGPTPYEFSMCEVCYNVQENMESRVKWEQFEVYLKNAYFHKYPERAPTPVPEPEPEVHPITLLTVECLASFIRRNCDPLRMTPEDAKLFLTIVKET